MCVCVRVCVRESVFVYTNRKLLETRSFAFCQPGDGVCALPAACCSEQSCKVTVRWFSFDGCPDCASVLNVSVAVLNVSVSVLNVSVSVLNVSVAVLNVSVAVLNVSVAVLNIGVCDVRADVWTLLSTGGSSQQGVETCYRV